MIFRIACGLLLTAFCSAQTPHIATQALSLKITTQQDTFKAGSPIILTVIETNISDHDILYSTVGHRRPFKLHIRDSKGAPVRETQEGMKADGTDPNRKPFVGSVFPPFALHPGKTIQHNIVLSKEYDLDKLGTYTIQAIEHDPSSHTTVKSNKLTITITPLG